MGSQTGPDLKWLSGQGTIEVGNPFKTLESRNGSWKEREGGA